MEPITEFKFTVDEQYENEKGVFTVLSIQDNEMVIQWKSGEKIRTQTDLQIRIQERRQLEKIGRETTGNATKSQSRKISSSFEGFQPSDFKNTGAKTIWRGRNQLGGAVTKQLPPDSFAFNSWAIAQKPEMHWADIEHWNRNDTGAQITFFARLDESSLSYGLYAERPDAKGKSSQDWDSFAAWLMQKENDRMLQALAVDSDMTVYDLARPAFGVLRPFEEGWRTSDENETQKIDRLAIYIDSVLTRAGIDLAIARKVPKDEAVARGKDIATDIAQLFALLMPLYEASVA